jgi:hypothetical protein
MKRLLLAHRILIPAILLAILMTSCGEAETAGLSEITKRWSVDRMEDAQTGEVITPEEDEFLAFVDGEEAVFNSHSPLLGIRATGSWLMEGDTLVIVPALDEVDITVDSITYHVVEGLPILRYYHNGQKVAEQLGIELTGDERPVVYTVKELTEETLVLESEDKIYYLSHQPTDPLFAEGFSARNLFRGLLGMLQSHCHCLGVQRQP